MKHPSNSLQITQTSQLKRFANHLFRIFFLASTLLFLTFRANAQAFLHLPWLRGGHSQLIYAVAFSPDGQFLASASWDGTAKLWRTADWELLRTFHIGASVDAVAFSPDSKTLVTSGPNVMMWDVSDGHLIRTFGGVSQDVYAVAFSPDGQTLVSAGTDLLSTNGTYRYGAQLWRVSDGQLLRKLLGHIDFVFCAAFSPDGQTDLLLENRTTGAITCWLMNGVTKAKEVVIRPNLDLQWQIVAAADYDGDGKPDLVFQSKTTGTIVYWQMDGTTVRVGRTIYGALDLNWKVVAVADFNGDGKPDLLFQNQTTGGIACWFMNGTQRLGSTYIVTHLDTNLRVVGAADMDGDGRTDIVFQNQATGAVLCWLMKGATQTGTVTIFSQLDPKWKVAGLRQSNSFTGLLASSLDRGNGVDFIYSEECPCVRATANPWFSS